MTNCARRSFCSMGICAASRARESAGDNPLRVCSRETCSAGLQETTTTAETKRVNTLVSNRSGASRTTTASRGEDHHSDTRRSSTARKTRPFTIDPSRRRAEGSAKTILPSASRSKTPPARTTEGHTRAMSATQADPGHWTSRTMASQSTTATPWSRRKMSQTVDLPQAIPPVRPKSFMRQSSVWRETVAETRVSRVEVAGNNKKHVEPNIKERQRKNDRGGPGGEKNERYHLQSGTKTNPWEPKGRSRSTLSSLTDKAVKRSRGSVGTTLGCDRSSGQRCPRNRSDGDPVTLRPRQIGTRCRAALAPSNTLSWCLRTTQGWQPRRQRPRRFPRLRPPVAGRVRWWLSTAREWPRSETKQQARRM